jgi:hypothetical protein
MIPTNRIITENRKLYPRASHEKVPCPRNPYLKVSMTEVSGLA